MDWHSSNVGAAIKKVKEQSLKLLVFIVGSDEVSKSVDGCFDSNVADVCKDLVCLRLEVNSEASKQFSAVYAVLSVPCIYLIGSDGKVLDIKLGTIEKDELSTWISQTVNKGATSSGASTSFPAHQSTTPGASQASTPHTEPKTIDVTEKSPQTTVAEHPVPLQERVDEALKTIEQKRQKRLAEEIAKATQEEKKRRETEKAVRDFKERQKELELQEAIAERRREKLEAQKLREQLKREIAEDRRAVRERSCFSSPQSTTACVRPVCEPVQSSSTGEQVRLQVRLPSGHRLIHSFPPTATVAGDLRNWLVEAAQSNSMVDEATRESLATVVTKGYRFRQLYPPRSLEPEDETRSMSDLGFHPSAVLVLVPSSTGRAVQPIGGGLFSGIYNLVATTIQTAYDYISRLVRGIYTGGSGLLTSISPNYSTNPAAPTQPERNRPSAQTQENRAVRRQGNMARLSHLPTDPDDEQARWNGNSTAQL